MSVFLILSAMVIPAAGGIFMLLRPARTEKGRRIWCEAVICLAAVCALSAILRGSVEPFNIYSFTRGFSITFQLDGLGMLFAGMVSLMWPFVTLYAFEYMDTAEHKNRFFAFYVMTYGVTLGVAFSADILTLYVFFEMLSLVTLPLVSHYQDHESMYAGRVYVAYVIGGAAIAFIPVVVTTMLEPGAFVWGGNAFGAFQKDFMLFIYVLGFFGFGVKAAVWPLHRWLPEATVAPTPVTALLHAVAVVNSGVFAVIRLTWYVFRPSLLQGTWAQSISLAAVSLTLLYAAGRAIRERHLKRRLAYSTVSNLSYMLYGVLLLTPDGFQAGMAHMLFHGIIKMSLFLCAGAFIHQTGCNYLYEINGVGKRMPFTFAFYTIGAMSLSGIPMLCGFVSKWKLLFAGAESGTVPGYIGMVCLVAAAFFCAIYTLSVSIRAFFPMEGTDRWKDDEAMDPGWRMLVPIGIFTAVNIFFGVMPSGILAFLGRVASGTL